MEGLKSSSLKLFVGKCREWDRGFFCPKTKIYFFKTPTKQVSVSFSLSFSLPNKKMHHIFSLSSPNTQTDFDNEELPNEDIKESKTVHVKFQIQRECSFGEHYLIVGEDPMLGLWNPSKALPLNWTDGHLWTVELDVPIGKSLKFKFILKGNLEEILWQPGPDRILQTWETEKTITVCEDWDSAELQKLIEEEPNSNHYEGSTTDPNMVTIDVVGESTRSDKTITNVIEMPISENPVMDTVAENITNPKENSRVNTVNTNNTAHTTIPSEDSGNDGRTVNKEDSESKKDEGELVSYGGVPVLVPGLSPLLTALDDNKVSTNEVETDIFVDALSEVDQAKELNVPEFNGNQIQLHHVKEEHEQKLTMPQIAKQQDQTPLDNAVLENDMQWGRRTLQKLLSNFGIQ